MAEFTKLIITDKGKELLSSVTTSTSKIEFTRVSTSDRAYREEEIASLTDLAGIKQTNHISSIAVQAGGKVKIEAAFENRELTEGYFIKAIGIYAKAGNDTEVLYAVAIEKTGRYSIPPYNNATVSAVYLKLFLAVEKFEKITLEVSPGAFITSSEIGRIKDELKRENTETKTKLEQQGEELKQSLTKAIKDIADSNGASTTTFNADGSIVTENSIETVTTTFNKADKSILEKHTYKNGTTKTLKTVFESKTIRTTEVN
nr:MAG TPA: tail-collar fiber protein [Caudoviricetes sp.]